MIVNRISLLIREITVSDGYILKLGLLSNSDFYLAKAAIAVMGGGAAMGVPVPWMNAGFI